MNRHMSSSADKISASCAAAPDATRCLLLFFTCYSVLYSHGWRIKSHRAQIQYIHDYDILFTEAGHDGDWQQYSPHELHSSVQKSFIDIDHAEICESANIFTKNEIKYLGIYSVQEKRRERERGFIYICKEALRIEELICSHFSAQRDKYV